MVIAHHHPCALIVALDVPSAQAAAAAAASLPDAVRVVKVGLELFVAEGPEVIAAATPGNRRCFLDLKLHDIPRTVAHAVRSAARHGAALLTVHAQGGEAMLRAAAEAAADCGPHRPQLLAVTTLTSLNQSDLAMLGVTRDLATHTRALAELAVRCGIDGLVCSPHEARLLRETLGPAPLLVTPGVRPAGGALGDQKRVATPADAVRAGADYLVVGRPILEAPSPREAAEAILREMAAAAI